MAALIDYCRSINCWVLQLHGDPAWQPDIVQANRERIAAMQCQSCRAWQYDQYRREAVSQGARD
jgi:hypothetical protein